MLLNKLYTLTSFEISGENEKVNAHILLNKEHPVFQGHFPGNPILPGVCTVQIITELMEKALEKDLMLTRAGNIKYLGFISPVTTPELLFEISVRQTETGETGCSVTVSAGGSALCSLRGAYIISPGYASHKRQ